MKLENITFKFNEKEIKIKIDHVTKTAWFSLWDLADFFERHRTMILKSVNAIRKNVNKNSQLVHEFAQVARNKATYMVTHYSQELVLLLCEKYEPELVQQLKEFIELNLMSYEPISVQDNDVIIFDNGKMKINVSVSQQDETVYLSQNDIAVLYGTTRENVNLHINNIIEEGELDINSICKYFLHMGENGRNYSVNKYNLDMILAVGYRTRTKDAIEFRRWVDKILNKNKFFNPSIWHFRNNRKRRIGNTNSGKHPALIVGESSDGKSFINLGLTRSPKRGHHNNLEIHDPINWRKISYLRNDIQIDSKEYLSEILKDFNLCPEDIEKILDFIKKKNPL